MCPVVENAHLSLCIIVTMERDLKLASSWCQIGYLTNLFLGSLISLRKGSVLGTNIWISIFKWILNENFKLIINCAVEQTLWHSLIPLFLGRHVCNRTPTSMPAYRYTTPTKKLCFLKAWMHMILGRGRFSNKRTMPEIMCCTCKSVSFYWHIL